MDIKLSPDQINVIGQLLIDLIMKLGHNKHDAERVVQKHPELIHEALEHGAVRLAARVSNQIHHEDVSEEKK